MEKTIIHVQSSLAMIPDTLTMHNYVQFGKKTGREGEIQPNGNVNVWQVVRGSYFLCSGQRLLIGHFMSGNMALMEGHGLRMRPRPFLR